jgi:hypothetical protein
MPPHRRDRGIKGVAAARQHRRAGTRQHIARAGGCEPWAARPGGRDPAVGRRDHRIGALVDDNGARVRRCRPGFVDLASPEIGKCTRKFAFMRRQDRGHRST